MSKFNKLINNIKNNPKNIKFETLQKVLLQSNFIERTPGGGSSHYTYIKGDKIITIPKRKPLKEIYVKKVIKMLEEWEGEKCD